MYSIIQDINHGWERVDINCTLYINVGVAAYRERFEEYKALNDAFHGVAGETEGSCQMPAPAPHRSHAGQTGVDERPSVGAVRGSNHSRPRQHRWQRLHQPLQRIHSTSRLYAFTSRSPTRMTIIAPMRFHTVHRHCTLSLPHPQSDSSLSWYPACLHHRIINLLNTNSFLEDHHICIHNTTWSWYF